MLSQGLPSPKNKIILGHPRSPCSPFASFFFSAPFIFMILITSKHSAHLQIVQTKHQNTKSHDHHYPTSLVHKMQIVVVTLCFFIFTFFFIGLLLFFFLIRAGESRGSTRGALGRQLTAKHNGHNAQGTTGRTATGKWCKMRNVTFMVCKCKMHVVFFIVVIERSTCCDV